MNRIVQPVAYTLVAIYLLADALFVGFARPIANWIEGHLALKKLRAWIRSLPPDGDAPHLNNIELGRHGRNRSNVWTYAGVNTFRKGRLDEFTRRDAILMETGQTFGEVTAHRSSAK